MYQSKLYSLYKTLDKKALRKFKKWIHSPAHNEHVFVQKLFQFIRTRKAFNAYTLQKERAWKYLYPKEEYRDLRMRHIMSIALEVLENFVRNYLSVEDVFYQEKILTKYFFEHKLNKQAYKKLEKSQVLLEDSTPDEQYYYHQYELELLKLEQLSQQNRTNDLNITAVLGNARLFFMITTLRYAYTALTQQNLRKVEYDTIPFLEHILTEVATNNYSAYPLLQVYYHSYYTLKTPEEVQHFVLLKSYLNHKELSIKEKRFILLICINYAAKQINLGKIGYAKEALDLYKYGLESRCIFVEEKISAFAYKNIVTLALNLKKFDWVASFIENYSEYLPTHLQENYKHFNTAKLAFDRGDLKKAMQLLIQVEYDELLLNIDAKVILLKIYYQEGYNDALEALLESFRVFLHRKKDLSAYKKSYINLILFIRKIQGLISDKEAVDTICREINNTQQLAERKWLLQQVKLK
jgi:hypothetical protein